MLGDKVIQAFRKAGITDEPEIEQAAPVNGADWQPPTEYPESADGAPLLPQTADEGFDPGICDLCGRTLDKHSFRQTPKDLRMFCFPIAGNEPASQEQKSAPLQFVTINPTAWRDTKPVELHWLAERRIRGNDLAILSGNGGAGKTEIATHLLISVSAKLGDWLGCVVDHGRALFISCEEDETDVRDRVERIAKHRGRDPHAIEDLHLFFPDLDATWLGTADPRTGRISKTPLLIQIEAWIAQHQPRLVVIDFVAAVFDGDAIQRRQVRAFLAMLRKIARDNNTAILLLDHPSVRGMQDGSGTANSVDWRNSVRSMLHLSDPDKDDADARTLEVKKNNRGRTGEKVALRWTGLTFTTEATAAASPHRAAHDAQVDEKFLELLDKATAQGRSVGPNSGSNYAPAKFGDDPDATGIKPKAFAAAMDRLFKAGKITTGVNRRRSTIIERAK